VSQFDILDQRHALCWDLATMTVKCTPQGEVLGNVLELMLATRSHEQVTQTAGNTNAGFRMGVFPIRFPEVDALLEARLSPGGFFKTRISLQL
jgi:hypothetical protein